MWVEIRLQSANCDSAPPSKNENLIEGKSGAKSKKEVIELEDLEKKINPL